MRLRRRCYRMGIFCLLRFTDKKISEQQYIGLSNKKQQLIELIKSVEKDEIEIQESLDHFKELRTQYKSRKQEINSLEAEKAMLLENMSKLKLNFGEKLSAVTQKEQKAGIVGFSRMKDELMKLSNTKSNLDSVKMNTLEEVSVLVKEINTKINEKKSIIGPKSSQLKKLRNKIAKQEEIINEKQFAYDAKILNIKKEVEELSKSNTLLQENIIQKEDRREELEDLVEVAKEHLNLLQEEKKKYSSKSEESLGTIKEKLKRKLYELETKYGDLSEEETNLRSAIEPNKKMIASFEIINKILEQKKMDNDDSLNASLEDAKNLENRMIL
eukprot:NODE_919_length_3055_cov_0.512855.p2 type:complete len:328 gc:universal NODE_919_length_3055_cov_0.512855:1520-2503(+)